MSQINGTAAQDAADENYRSGNPCIAIRSYVPGDYPQVYGVWEEAELHPFTEPEVARLLRCCGGAVVAEATHPDGTVAIVGVALWSHNGQSAWLWKLGVRCRYRHQGVARRLLRQVEREVADADLPSIGLLTRRTNQPARTLYTREGWTNNTQHEFWGKRLDPARNRRPVDDPVAGEQPIECIEGERAKC